MSIWAESISPSSFFPCGASFETFFYEAHGTDCLGIRVRHNCRIPSRHECGQLPSVDGGVTFPSFLLPTLFPLDTLDFIVSLLGADT